MEHTLTSEQWLAQTPPKVFDFFSDASNLEKITPPELRFEILTPVPLSIEKDTLIEYRLRLGPFPFLWKTRITDWNPPYSFVDEQLCGPYKQWIHRHSFEDWRGGTLMKDRVHYRLPLEPIGDLADPLIRLQLGRIFRYRRKVIARMFE